MTPMGGGGVAVDAMYNSVPQFCAFSPVACPLHCAFIHMWSRL